MVLYPHMTRRDVLGGLVIAASAVTGASAFEGAPSFNAGRHQFTFFRTPRVLPPIRATGLDGRTVDLVLGRVTLVNLWASWCAACRTELPLLERVHLELAGQGVRVAAISADRAGPDAVVPFLRKLGIRKLPVYLDWDGLVGYSDADNRNDAPFALYSMPITYLVDSARRVVGYLPGEADWTSPDGRRLLAYYAEVPGSDRPSR